MKMSENFKLIGISMLLIVGLVACGKHGGTEAAAQNQGKVRLYCEYKDPHSPEPIKISFDVDFDASTINLLNYKNGLHTLNKQDSEYGNYVTFTDEAITLYDPIRTSFRPFIVIYRKTGRSEINPLQSGANGHCSKDEGKNLF